MLFEDIKGIKIATSIINEVVDLIQDFIDVPPTKHYTDKDAYKLLDEALEKIIAFENDACEIIYETNVIGRKALDPKLQCEIIKLIKDKLLEQKNKTLKDKNDL